MAAIGVSATTEAEVAAAVAGAAEEWAEDEAGEWAEEGAGEDSEDGEEAASGEAITGVHVDVIFNFNFVT